MTTQIIKDYILNEEGSAKAKIIITIPDISRVNRMGNATLIAIPSSRNPNREYIVAVDVWGRAYSCSCRVGRKKQPCGHLSRAELVWSYAETRSVA